MSSSRMRALSVAALALGGLAALVAIVAGSPPADAGHTVGGVAIGTCAARPATGHGVARQPGTFFRIEPRLDAAGGLIGQRLTVGRDGVASGIADLAAESGASGPVQGVVVMVEDDGARSRAALVSASGRCAATIYSTPLVIRRAILDPADGSLFVHLLDRATRADVGTWRVSGTGDATRVLDALPASLGLGRIWATDLELDADGARLAVQSCLDVACLTRVVDLDAVGGPPVVVRGASQGAMIGLTPGQLITWAACDGSPCGLLAWDVGAASPRALVDDAVAAALTGDGRLLFATLAGTSSETNVAIDPASGTAIQVHGLQRGERPLGISGSAVQGLEADPTGIAVATSGGTARVVHLSLTGEVLP